MSRSVYVCKPLQVGSEVVFQTWRWVAFLILIGVALG